MDKRRWSKLTAILFAGLLFYGCRSNSSKPESLAKAKPITHQVIIKDMKFQPGALTVHIGDSVVFTNDGIVPHNITEQDKAWASPNLAVGDSWGMVVKEDVDYYCSIHIVMKGKIVAQ